jgi:hypothetical protein
MLSGTVAHTLTLMSGVWHDHVEVFDLAGNPLAEDVHSGTPGAAPWDNLVYIEFDGEHYRQTNVTFNGRPLHVRSFAGRLIDGVLVFNKLGPEAPEHIGVSGGAGVLFFCPRAVDEAWQRYSEPDCIRLIGPGQRTRTTVLYRNGVAVRTLTAYGTKVAPLADRRVSWDPRGSDGPVHNLPSETQVFRSLVDNAMSPDTM